MTADQVNEYIEESKVYIRQSVEVEKRIEREGELYPGELKRMQKVTQKHKEMLEILTRYKINL